MIKIRPATKAINSRVVGSILKLVLILMSLCVLLTLITNVLSPLYQIHLLLFIIFFFNWTERNGGEESEGKERGRRSTTTEVSVCDVFCLFFSFVFV